MCHTSVQCNFIKKEALAQVFSSEFFEISKNTFSYRSFPVAASVNKIFQKSNYAFFVQISLKMKFLPQHWLFGWVFAQSLYVFFKSKLIINFYPQKLFIAHTWKLLITNIHMMTFLISKRKVEFIWIHFYMVIPKPQSKAFRHTLYFINYLQLWTTNRWKWRVTICLTY